MSHSEKLSLTLQDVYGKRVKGRVDVYLEHQTMGSATRKISDHLARHRMIITNLALGTYKVTVYPTHYRPVTRYCMIGAGRANSEVFTLAVDPDKVIQVITPEYEHLNDDLKHVLENSDIEAHDDLKGESLYTALDNIRKAGLLNIYHKMKATVFQNGRDTFSFVDSITRIRGDRFFAHVKKDLRDEVKSSLSQRLFKIVPNLDHDPPRGYEKAGSFKTRCNYGNLQLTFFCKEDDLKFMIDADIDDAAGLLHTFHVIEHTLTGTDTHPYDIHQILLQHQKLDPNYVLLV